MQTLLSAAPLVIAIDGPAGAGKSSAARMLAKRLGFMLLDTGAIYRCLALRATQQFLSVEDVTALTHVAAHLPIQFMQSPDDPRIFLQGVDVTERIREPDVSAAASQFAWQLPVRVALLPLQRQLAGQAPCVVEGRDMGTVVFPTARLKFFITARPEIRARRRWREMGEKGHWVPWEHVLSEQTERDQRDANRQVAPTLPADDAILLDTSDMALEQVVDLMERHARARFAATDTL